MKVLKLPKSQAIDFLALALLHREPGRIPLNDPDDLFLFALDFTSLATLWDACPRSDWMLWMLENAAKWELVPRAIADHILNDNELVSEVLFEVQAEVIRKSTGNPFAFINEQPLKERRLRVEYVLAEGDAALVTRIVALFKPTVH